jgi:hypothetical protein
VSACRSYFDVVLRSSLTFIANDSPRGAQMMILFPLMTTWMWFQIFAASPLAAVVRPSKMRATMASRRSE